jgi:hypothetical protein
VGDLTWIGFYRIGILGKAESNATDAGKAFGGWECSGGFS